MLVLLLLVLGFLASCILWSSLPRENKHLGRIPTVGPGGIFGSYVGAFRYIFDARGMIQEGYEKRDQSFFKIPTFRTWIILVNHPTLIDALAKASEELSFNEAIAETLQTDYLLGNAIRENPFHIDLIRSPLTRSAGALVPEIHRLIEVALEERIESSFGVTTISTFSLAKHLVQRANSRVLVGPPSKHSKNLDAICERFTSNLITTSHLLKLFPPPLKCLGLRYLTSIPNDIRAATTVLNHILSESSVSEGSEGREQCTFLEMLVSAQGTYSLRDAATRLLAVKMTADHSTTLALTHLLFDLAISPNEVAEIRPEVENAAANLGWTPSAFKMMKKLDSFIKESQRLSAHSAYIMVRKVVKDFTFPDGTVIPVGSTIAVPGPAINVSNNNYVEAHKFKGFRFTRSEDNASKDFSRPNPQRMVFGYGRHACPGRMMALQVLKSIAAHLVLHYDLELEGGQYRPPDLWIGAANTPNTHAKIRLRRRGEMISYE